MPPPFVPALPLAPTMLAVFMVTAMVQTVMPVTVPMMVTGMPSGA